MAWLNYHHLLYFWTVARTGSVTAAAKELRLAHPTISSQIHTLEKNLGQKLFKQVGRKLEMTSAGRLAYGYANEIFSLGQDLLRALEGRRAEEAPFRVGVTDVLPKPIAHRFLQPALAIEGFRAVCFEGKLEVLAQQLAARELDLVLSDLPLDADSRLNAFSHLLGESGVCLFGSSRLAQKYRRGFPESLDEAPFLLPTENTSLRRLLNHWFAGWRMRPHIVAEFEDSELLKESGQAGLGVFAASAVIEQHTLRHYRVKVIGRLDTVRMKYYAISTERSIRNPAIVAIVEAAHREIFTIGQPVARR